MHAKHDYNPLKTAYPIESTPDFDTSQYPDSSVGKEPDPSATANQTAGAVNVADAVYAAAIAAAGDNLRSKDEQVEKEHAAEDLALLEKTQKTAFHQSKDFQGAQAYRGQQYEPSDTELESTISWTLLIGCSILLILALLIGGGIFSLFLAY